MSDDDLTPEDLAQRQREQEQAARRALDEAATEAEAKRLERQADKARYLREKLRQQEQADQE
jgi:hypothetical protein